MIAFSGPIYRREYLQSLRVEVQCKAELVRFCYRMARVKSDADRAWMRAAADAVADRNKLAGTLRGITRYLNRKGVAL